MENPSASPIAPDDWPATTYPAVDPQEVHVWRASLASPDADVRTLESRLPAEEQQQAARFRFDRDRRRFVMRRSIARALLGQYLHAPSERVAFVYSPYGKPALATPFDGVGLSFNVSHSDDLALVAIALHRAVGVDVERVRPLTDAAAIARRHFSTVENLTLDGLEPSARMRAFFTCWTRKEAYLKATGEGLTGRLSEELSPQQGWCLRELTPDPDFVAAIAARGDDWTVRCWHWGGRLP